MTTSGDSKKIIIAPLNWGLGHATRCIPIIRYVISLQHDVLLASDGAALELLRIEFPNLPFVELPPYNILYEGNNMVWNMAKQLPSIQKTIREEHATLRHILIDFQADLIISDNRYGFYNNACPSVIICHQINIPVRSFLSPIVNWGHHRFLSRFDKVWIPDFKGSDNLTGDMTARMGKLQTQFIGPQSRFERIENIKLTNQIMCVLSGPEPQRTMLEKKLITQLALLDIPSIIIQGQVHGSEDTVVDVINKCTIINYLSSDNLNRRLQESKYIIARSGYSTIMDLIKINRSALLIPTPGQPEQEYLARYLSDKNWMVTQNQADIDVEHYLIEPKSLKLPILPFDDISHVLDSWL